MKLIIGMRMAFIDHCLTSQRAVCRQDLVSGFGISAQQASIDFRTFVNLHPTRMKYCVTDKRYKPCGRAVYSAKIRQAVSQLVSEWIKDRYQGNATNDT